MKYRIKIRWSHIKWNRISCDINYTSVYYNHPSYSALPICDVDSKIKVYWCIGTSYRHLI